MFSRLALSLFSCALAFGVLAACGGKAEPDAAPKTVNDFFPIKIGDQTVKMQIAALPAEQERGLMFRSALGRDEGMLFVFTRAQPMAFWMRNTIVPLDIGYIGTDGVLREIYPMYPRDERSVPSHARDLQFALEVNQGWFKEHGVKPGAKLDLKAVRDALKARGLDPRAAGL
ncbi:MAG: DUF192 domain-containing protein [Opitutae bacterium]|nr:DUF192 domain-containing protein [Opitutae bacterium]